MRRLVAISLAASIIALWAVSARAGGLDFSTGKPPFTHTIVPGGTIQRPIQRWSDGGRDPAIVKTLRPYYAAPQPAPSPDVPGHEWQAPVEQWQQPTYPGSRFSYPQQGFYPREGYQQQHPGYEYDFDQGDSYGSQYPIEGASWRTRHPAWRATGFSDPQQTLPVRRFFYGTYAPCPQF